MRKFFFAICSCLIHLFNLLSTFFYCSVIFPVLNEFEIVDSILTTQGGELYYEDGKEYIGPYHIHPDKGPMVGAQHISEPHERLFYSKDLQDQNQLIKNF